MTHDEAREILPLHALGALDGADREALEAHLAGCPACREALREEVQAVAVLAHAPAQVAPRPELRARVLAAARSAPGGAVAAFPADIPAARADSPPSASRAWPWLVAAAAAVLAVIASVGLFRARAELADVRAELLALESRLADASERTERATAQIRVQQQALDVLGAPDLLRATLAGVPPAAGARAQALFSRAQGTLVLSAHGLPSPPAGRVYQLWAIVGSQPVGAGTFTPEADGVARVIASVALDGAPAAFAVTLEPEGGVPAPTGPKYLLGAPAN